MTKRAGLIGLALLLGACGAENAPPEAPTPDEQQALAEAEEMIEAGRPDPSGNGEPDNHSGK